MSDIAKKISAKMEEKDLSYGDLSRMTQIPKSALYRYVTGDTPKIPLDRLKIIARALNITQAYLMGWEEEQSETDTETKEQSRADELRALLRNSKTAVIMTKDENGQTIIELTPEELTMAKTVIDTMRKQKEQENK